MNQSSFSRWLTSRKQYAREYAIAIYDRLLGYAREKGKFKRAHGYKLNLKNPQSFNEKIVWKKLYDRNPLLQQIADKHAVRDYVRSVLGDTAGEKLLVPLLHATERPETIPFATLPAQFVIKSSHGSARNIIVWDKTTLDQAEVIDTCQRWLMLPYGLHSNEWAYQSGFPKKVLIEELMLDDRGAVPSDFKLSMIHGECVFIKVDADRRGEFVSTLYDQNWQKLECTWNRRQSGAAIDKPACLDEMLAHARKLAAPLDYVRIDFYVVNDRPYLGEMTNYPMKGRGRITPTSVDFAWGQLWSLPGLPRQPSANGKAPAKSEITE